MILLGALALGLMVGAARAAEPDATLVVCNAGSLAAPLAQAVATFRRAHPSVTPEQESAGSLDLVRSVTELGRRCDLLAVADFEVLPALIVPKHARWYVVFARNRLVLVFRRGAPGAADIGRVPWWEILLRPGIEQGHSDPDADPAGYRTRLAWELAERHYGVPGLARRLAATVPARNVRPKSVELVALLEAGELDYAWTYASVAAQAGLPFHELPREIDLGDPALAPAYARVSVEVAGNAPGTRRTVHGLPILYGLTIPTDAPNAVVAEAFVDFLLGPEGRAVLRAAHVEPLDPPQASDPAALPRPLAVRCAPLAFAPPAG